MARLPKEPKHPVTPPSTPYPRDSEKRRSLRALTKEREKDEETHGSLPLAGQAQVASSSGRRLRSHQQPPTPSSSQLRVSPKDSGPATLSHTRPPRSTDDEGGAPSTSRSRHRSANPIRQRSDPYPRGSTPTRSFPLTPPPSASRSRKARQPHRAPPRQQTPSGDLLQSTPQRRHPAPSSLREIAIARMVEQLEVHTKCYLCDGFVGMTPYTIACGHTYCGPCLRQEFETQLRKSLSTFRFTRHSQHQPEECQVIPRTEEQKSRLSECAKQHGSEPEWIFQYQCPRVDCGASITVEPSVDKKLKGVLEDISEALQGRFHPSIYTADVDLPVPVFIGLFQGDV